MKIQNRLKARQIQTKQMISIRIIAIVLSHVSIFTQKNKKKKEKRNEQKYVHQRKNIFC